MSGALIGDIVGSLHEFANTSNPRFPLLSKGNEFTDDTVCTIAAIVGSIAEARWGIPEHIREKALELLPGDMRSVLEKFKSVFCYGY